MTDLNVPEGDRATTSSDRRAKARHADYKARTFSVIELLAFLLGLAIFLYPLIAAYMNYGGTTREIDDYDRIVDSLSPAQRREMWKEAKQYDEDLGKPTLRDPFKYKEIQEPLGRYSKILNVDGKGMMAYVEIPKIGVKLPIRHGTTDDVLDKGIGHIATTHVPTDNRTIHSVVTGHTGEVGHILFDNLTQMRIGDVFQIRVLDRHMSYKVDQIKVILPTDVSALQPVEGTNYVTLLTCTPYGINSHRLIIRGRYVGDDVPVTQPTGAPNWMLWVLFVLFVLSAVGWYVSLGKRRKCRSQLAELAALASTDAGGGGADVDHQEASSAGTVGGLGAAVPDRNDEPPGRSSSEGEVDSAGVERESEDGGGSDGRSAST